MSNKTTESFSSRAPTRIDLAGGTVDIWPLYLFLPNARTLNLGINLFAEVKLETSLDSHDQGRLEFESLDQKQNLKTSWKDLWDLSPPPALSLHVRLLRFFAQELKLLNRLNPKLNLKLTTQAKSPAGAGLGGSSTLSIALIGALASWARGPFDKKRDGERFIEIVRDTETTVISVPAGLQDYYGAMYGGLQSLRWLPGQNEHFNLENSLLKELEKRLILFYSGHSRNSGINNWALFKAFIDQDLKVKDQFLEIAQATLEAETALLKKDWMSLGKAIAKEWETRKTLAQGISTPEINQAFEICKKESSVTAGKICGAGGGGCFFVYEPSSDPKLREKLIKQVTHSSPTIQHLEFKSAPQGLEVWAP